MDSSVILRIVRDDEEEFLIDNTSWLPQIKSFDGWGDFTNTISTVDNAIGDGGVISSYRLAIKDRTIRAVAINQEQKQLLRASATAFFSSRRKYKVYITYMGKTLWCEGMVHKFKINTGRDFAPLDMTITFLCPAPYLYSFDDFGKDIASMNGMVAFPYLCGITDNAIKGITGGRFIFSQLVILENDGDVETYCKARIVASGNVQNPKFLINGKYVKVNDTLVADDEILIDFTAMPPTVKKNGVNWIGHCDRQSEFDDMELAIGDNEISFDADYGSNLMSVSVYYNKLYGVI